MVLFVAGSIGSLNEFTIAYDEGKIIGCLIGTGGWLMNRSELSQRCRNLQKLESFTMKILLSY